MISRLFCFFFFNDTATTEIYTLSLHDALPIWRGAGPDAVGGSADVREVCRLHRRRPQGRQGDGTGLAAHGSSDADGQAADRKSTRLNSSHSQISYAVFCLKKKKKKIKI